ncbi:hypothetical protein ACIP5Y_32190 [Nocardia sp. NPDC088792]|uniref:hypothetical protein n=1 Tax=Nocardia sp. NPDC088792 TaxID=3364332 RepID=UPI0037F42B60
MRRDLLSLDKSNAEAVARHLVMVAQLLDEDPEQALQHARAARQRAGRIAVVRETAGVAAYHAGEWAEALSELRTARRMSGGAGLLAVMADCERGLGRPERAIELGRSDEARMLTGDEATELRIVVAGARMDLGQYDQAVVSLQTPELDPARTGPAAARLFYAYAEALLAAGREEEALTWFMNAASADVEGDTDAEERAAALSEGDDGSDWTAAFDDEDEDDRDADDEAADDEDSDDEDSDDEDSDEISDEVAAETDSAGTDAAESPAEVADEDVSGATGSDAPVEEAAGVADSGETESAEPVAEVADAAAEAKQPAAKPADDAAEAADSAK